MMMISPMLMTNPPLMGMMQMIHLLIPPLSQPMHPPLRMMMTMMTHYPSI